jgi:hypothetical protein
MAVIVTMTTNLYLLIQSQQKDVARKAFQRLELDLSLESSSCTERSKDKVEGSFQKLGAPELTCQPISRIVRFRF